MIRHTTTPSLAALTGALLLHIGVAQGAAVITFDTVATGATSFGFDGDGDTIDDVVFSTTDPFGFNTVGPGPNQSYINEPGIEGTTRLNPDLRVDFVYGAVSSLSFGFAMSLGTGNLDGVTFTVFDADNNVLASTSRLSNFTLPNGVDPSSFPEGQLSLAFGGVASYALFDFSQNQATRYIIDNFAGKFGSSNALKDNVAKSTQLLALYVDAVELNVAYLGFLAPYAALCGVGAVIPLTLGACATVVAGVVAINASSAWELGQIINDPPDPNYNEVYSPLTVDVPMIPNDPDSNFELVGLLNEYLTVNGEYYSLLNAWRVTLERMSAAIEDGDLNAAILQYKALLDYMQKTSEVASILRNLTIELADQFEHYAGPIEITSDELRLAFEQFLEGPGSDLLAQLLAAGVPSNDAPAIVDSFYSYNFSYIGGNPFDSFRNYGSSLSAFVDISRCNGPCDSSPPPSPVSEPGTLALLGLGLVGIGLRRRTAKATR